MTFTGRDARAISNPGESPGRESQGCVARLLASGASRPSISVHASAWAPMEIGGGRRTGPPRRANSWRWLARPHSFNKGR